MYSTKIFQQNNNNDNFTWGKEINQQLQFFKAFLYLRWTKMIQNQSMVVIDELELYETLEKDNLQWQITNL
jgi:hypothetical protein